MCSEKTGVNQQGDFADEGGLRSSAALPSSSVFRPSSSVTVICPTRGWRALGLHDVWEYRELLYFLTWREIKSRYRQMALGPLWVVLMPLLNMVVFSVVFGAWAKLPSDGLPPPLYYYAALLPWQLFAVSAGKAATSLVNNLNLISKVYFPRMIIPVAASAVGLFDFCCSFLILVVMMAWYHIAPGAAVILLPGYLLLAVAAALAVGLWLASVAVRFRDVAYGITFLMQVWMFATIVYPASQVPEEWRTLYRLNPMQPVVEGCRWALLGRGHGPDAVQAASVALVLALLVAGAYVFRRTERNIVDVL